MFLLFLNLYYAMLNGAWVNNNWDFYVPRLKNSFNAIELFLTSIFGNVTDANLGTALFENTGVGGFYTPLAFILATITSIGIVVMAVKGIKKVFGIFFMGIRR